MENKTNMQTTEKELTDLIVIIVNRGYSDDAMDAAREAGAKGGTIIHGRGTGSIETEKFFNLKLHEEKDMVFIVAQRSVRNKIMDAIMRKAGLNTEAHGVVFSLPAEDFTVLSKNRIDKEDE